MKNIVIYFFFLLSFSNFNTVPEQIIAHDIKSVTVFLNSAEIRRTGYAVVPKGKSDIILRGISNRILNQGMKISLSSGVQVYAVSVEDDPTNSNENPELQKINSELKAKELELKLTSVTTQTLQKEIE